MRFGTRVYRLRTKDPREFPRSYGTNIKPILDNRVVELVSTHWTHCRLFFGYSSCTKLWLFRCRNLELRLRVCAFQTSRLFCCKTRNSPQYLHILHWCASDFPNGEQMFMFCFWWCSGLSVFFDVRIVPKRFLTLSIALAKSEDRLRCFVATAWSLKCRCASTVKWSSLPPHQVPRHFWWFQPIWYSTDFH